MLVQPTRKTLKVQYNILIVDDHPIVQSGLRLLFATQDRYRIAGALDRGADVAAFLQAEPVDLILLDLDMPDVRGVDLLADIVGAHDVAVIILTAYTKYDEVDYALKLGARGAVSKADAPSEIIAACDTVLAGDVYIAPHIQIAFERHRQPPVRLSSRQKAILHYLSQGEQNKEISYRLAIAQTTVSFHIAELRRKLNAANNRKIVDRAHELGLM